jgi:peroxiredoxin
LAVEAGETAPEFTLNATNGHTYNLEDALGRGPMLLMFFKTTCATCDVACPYVNRLREAYPAGWSVWGISQHPLEESKRYAQAYEIGYPVLLDDEGFAVSKVYDPPATPTFYLIGMDGEVMERSVGFDKAELNHISKRLAHCLGLEPVEIAPDDDGNPPSRPGCAPRHLRPGA